MTKEKPCFKCGETKPLIEFYKHPQMADGHVNKCKECNKRDVRENRNDKIDYYLAYDRMRANIPKRVEARKAYAQTDHGIAVARAARIAWAQTDHGIAVARAARIAYLATPHGRSAANKSKRQWSERNTIKRAAQTHTRRAVRDGRLIRPDACEECGSGNVHGHHDDYAMPLAVRWLCAGCHKAWHRAHGCGKNG